MNPYKHLSSHPHRVRTPSNVILTENDLEPVREQQVLVRNLFMSVDSYMRSRMNAGQSYIPAFKLGKLLEGGVVGEVVQSWAKEFKAGDVITSRFGWREYFFATPQDLHPVSRGLGPLSVCLGVLGMAGMTALAG